MTTINSNTTYTWQPVNGSIGGMAAQITALLTAGGWIQTADTGQTSNATFATIYNGTLNSSSGYQIWRMNDSLQGTYPVFIKIEFGCGSVSNTPAMWVTIGTGSNGTGTITGIVIARTQFNAGLTASTVLITIVGSASTNRICFYNGPYTGGYGFVLGIERSKDTSNADTTDGVMLYGTSGASPISAYGSFSGLNRAPQAAANIVIVGSLTDESDGYGNVVVFPVFPMAQYGSKNPGLNFRFYATANLPINNALPISVRGSNHTYFMIGSQGLTFISNWASVGTMLLYE